MDIFLKATACVLIATVLIILLSKEQKDISILISIATCCLVLAAASEFIAPVLSFLFQLQQLGNLDNTLVSALIKAVGITLLSQIASMICQDAGYSVLGKVLQILSTAVVLWITIPLYEGLIHLVQEILGAL